MAGRIVNNAAEFWSVMGLSSVRRWSGADFHRDRSRLEWFNAMGAVDVPWCVR